MKTELKLYQGDITKVKADAIVNAANSSLSGGGGVDGAIHRAAGNKLFDACKSLGGCDTGEAKITSGFDLPARYVIHAVGPVWHGGSQNEEILLASCYRNALMLASQYELRSIAFPSISTGAYRFPIQRAAPIAINTIMVYTQEHADDLEQIIFVLFNDKDLAVYSEYLKRVK